MRQYHVFIKDILASEILKVLTVASSRKFTEEELKQLYSKGLTVRQIAERLGVSETTILRRMKKLGLDTKRSSSDKSTQEIPKDSPEKRRREDKYSFLPPPSGGPPL